VAKFLTTFAFLANEKWHFWRQNLAEIEIFLRKVEAKSLELFWQDFIE